MGSRHPHRCDWLGDIVINWIDILILVMVFLIIGAIVYFGFIKNREKGSCRNCPEANGVKASRLLRDYKRKYKKGKKQE